MKKLSLREFILLSTVALVLSNSTTALPKETSPPEDTSGALTSKLIAAVNVLIVQEDSNSILLIDEHQSSKVNVVFKLPTILSLFDHCAEDDLETIKTRLDSNSEFQQIEQLVIHLRESFLAELKRENGYSNFKHETASRNNRSTSSVSATKPIAAPTTNNKLQWSRQTSPLIEKNSGNAPDDNQRVIPMSVSAEISDITITASPAEDSKIQPLTPRSSTTSEILPTIGYYPIANSYQKGVCLDVLTSGLGPFIEDCGPPLTCCNQFNCPYGSQRNTISMIIDYVNDETAQDISNTQQNFCFAPWDQAPSSDRGRRRRSMGLFEYWSHGEGLAPSSMNKAVENLKDIEDTKIRKIAEKMVTTGDLNTAINGQESEISLLKDSLCIANTNTVNQLKLSELQIGYSNLATKIEDSIRVCSQNSIPTAVHYRLLSEACSHLNPNKDVACKHPEVLEAFGCQVKAVAIGQDRIELTLSLSIPIFVDKMQLSHIFAFPFKGRNHDVRVVDNLPKYVSVTDRHLFVSTCEERENRKFTICSLAGSLNNNDLTCLNALISSNAHAATIFCSSSVYKGDNCQVKKLRGGIGLAVWSGAPLEVSYPSQHGLQGRTDSVVNPFSPQLLTQGGTQVHCNGLAFPVPYESSEVVNEVIDDIALQIPNSQSDNVESNMQLLNKRLDSLKTARSNDLKSALNKTEFLSSLLNVPPKHESWLKIVFGIGGLIISIAAVYTLAKLTCRFYFSAKKRTEESRAARLQNQLDL